MLVLFFLPVATFSVEISEKEALRLVLDSLYPSRGVQLVALRNYGGDGRLISKKKVQIVSDYSGGVGKALLRIVEPETLRGVSVLIDGSELDSREILAYLPSVGATRRVAGLAERESFFGTALTFFDLLPKGVGEFVASWSSQSTIGHCRSMSVLPVRPGPDGYDRIEVCIDLESGFGRELKFFDAGELARSVVVELSSIREIAGRSVAFEFSVHSSSRDILTRVSVLRLEPAAELEGRIFSVLNLERGSADSDRAMIMPTD